jgi:hypothetical protein
VRAASVLATVVAGGLAAALARPAPAPLAPPSFEDVTEKAGLAWGCGLARGDWNLVETMGGGGGFLDYDGDGRLDVYLVANSLEPDPRTGRASGDGLFRNNGDGTFTDVTARAGIRGRRRGMGLAVADYDDDGWPDLYVSGHTEGVLYRNQGDGTFRDVTAAAGVRNRLWGCSATFLDYDRDGRPDLFVSNYLEFDPSRPGTSRYPCEMIDGYPFCSIVKFQGQPSVLYRNRGDGTFEDASVKAGIAGLVGKGMGVVAADLDDDGWIDVFQTNDSAPNFLFQNGKDGAFREVALEAEVAFDPSGRTTGAMATDAEDVDGDGRLDLLVTNFNNQGTFLQRNNGGMRFVDRGNAVGLGMSMFKYSTFGARFLDYDLDGDADLFVAAGHPFAPVSKVWPEIRYAEPPFLFEGDGGRFANVAPERGAPLRVPHVGRGVAVADYDDDGDPDVLLLCVGEPPRLLRNDGGNRNHWLGVRLVGTRSGRDGIGARVAVTAGGRTQVRARLGGASYLTASDPRLLFGLGRRERADAIEVRWPSGHVDRFPGAAANRYVTLTEGQAKAAPVPAAAP